MKQCQSSSSIYPPKEKKRKVFHENLDHLPTNDVIDDKEGHGFSEDILSSIFTSWVTKCSFLKCWMVSQKFCKIWFLQNNQKKCPDCFRCQFETSFTRNKSWKKRSSSNVWAEIWCLWTELPKDNFGNAVRIHVDVINHFRFKLLSFTVFLLDLFTMIVGYAFPWIEQFHIYILFFCYYSPATLFFVSWLFTKIVIELSPNSVYTGDFPCSSDSLSEFSKNYLKKQVINFP